MKEGAIILVTVGIFLTGLVVLLSWADKAKTEEGPDQYSLHCIYGIEYVYFKEGYGAGLAPMYNSMGNIKRCNT